MGVMAYQITSLTIVYLTIYSGEDQRKHQSSASLAFVREICGEFTGSPHKWPVTRKMFPFDDVIMLSNDPMIKLQWIFNQISNIFTENVACKRLLFCFGLNVLITYLSHQQN